MSDQDEIIIAGRKAYLARVPQGDNPYDSDSVEGGIWLNAWIGEQLHTEQIGLQFSAEKMLSEKVEEQQEQIKTLQARLLLAQTHRDEYKNDLGNMSVKRNVYERFVLRLRDNPPRWAKKYREMVEVFCESIGI